MVDNVIEKLQHAKVQRAESDVAISKTGAVTENCRLRFVLLRCRHSCKNACNSEINALRMSLLTR